VLAEGNACNSGFCVESSTGEWGRATRNVNKKKDGNCKRQVGLYTGENKRDMTPENSK
jgi:hypothetical protein